ncbi:cation:proton antiporter [Kitasatospora sp. NPDC017646]|uniref:cation:proton antiporter n=1 Tax=Kitasatospora sp. NPDC017646 TaxID=3364024 RepID=UPI0037A8C5EC
MTEHQVEWMFLGLGAVLALGRLFGTAARRLGQPEVVGEIVAGILIGPTLFGGALSKVLLPTDIRPMLSGLANLGLALFMFVIGYELRYTMLRESTRVAVRVSVSSMVLPFVLGAVLALQLAGDHPSKSRTGFVIFMAAAMSVTAFPVLARILSDRGMDRTRLGTVALASAAICDLAAWGLLALAAFAAGGAGPQRLLFVPVYLGAVFFVVRPLLGRLFASADAKGASATQVCVLLCCLLLSCWATEWMGIHFIFGAFLLGAVAPRGTRRDLGAEISGQVQTFGRLLLLPAYFVLAGTKVDLSSMGLSGLGELVLILLTAVTGKFIGAYAGARSSAVPPLQSTALAALMNTRGLTELVFLTAGLQLGVIDVPIYSLMVVMALVTTGLANPVLRLLERHAGGGSQLLGSLT